MLTYGATCHFIVPELDAGNQIIYQSTFTIPPGMKLDNIICRGQEDNEPHCLVEGVRRVVSAKYNYIFTALWRGVSCVLNKGTGSAPTSALPRIIGLRCGACPLFQRSRAFFSNQLGIVRNDYEKAFQLRSCLLTSVRFNGASSANGRSRANGGSIRSSCCPTIRRPDRRKLATN